MQITSISSSREQFAVEATHDGEELIFVVDGDSVYQLDDDWVQLPDWHAKEILVTAAITSQRKNQ